MKFMLRLVDVGVHRDTNIKYDIHPFFFTSVPDYSMLQSAQRGPLLLDATSDDPSHGVDSGKFTTVDLVHAYLAGIEERTVRAKSITEINPLGI